MNSTVFFIIINFVSNRCTYCNLYVTHGRFSEFYMVSGKHEIISEFLNILDKFIVHALVGEKNSTDIFGGNFRSFFWQNLIKLSVNYVKSVWVTLFFTFIICQTFMVINNFISNIFQHFLFSFI